MKRFSLFLCALALLTGCNGDAGNLSLEQRLQRGVNLQLAENPTHQHDASGRFEMPAKSDLKLIQKMGLRHVRIRIDPTELMAVGGLAPARSNDLHRVIERIQSYGLTTILTTQPDSEFKAALEPGSPITSSFANFWRALAKHLSDIDPQALVFEPLNEPEHESAADWQNVQELLVGAVRAGAPKHQIIVAGHRFSSIPELVQIEPLPYDNLLYSFHFYDPHNFTHQGANWGWPMWQNFHDWPYPSSPDTVAPLLGEHVLEAREHLEHYGRQSWNKQKLAEELQRAITWATANNVKLMCTEFGAYGDGIEPRYRQAWLTDVADLLEQNNIGWTLWDYSGNFGIVSGDANEREVDSDALRALHLKVP